MHRVLGIDPGLQRTGYAVVELRVGWLEPTLLEAGIIQLSPRLALEVRLDELHKELIALIERLTPSSVAVEKLFAHYKHPRTAILMAHARGVILLAAQAHGIAVEHLPSTAVKKAITGFGHASKLQMQQAIQSQCHLRELPSPPDVADAIAIALTHARRRAIQQM